MSENTEPTNAAAAREAFLLHDQLANMRENARHLNDLEGMAAFVQQFNDKVEEVRRVVARDPLLLQTLDFLRPIAPETKGSEYPSAIIDGKRGQFMVASGILMNALENFMRLYLSDEDRERLLPSRPKS